MKSSYIPKLSTKQYCEWLKLCSVRTDINWVVKIWIKFLDWSIRESLLEEIINENYYRWKPIIRVYSSGHVFIDEARTKVYLLTTEKNWRIQYQFTGGSPQEEENKDVIIKENWVFKFDLDKVNQNALIRTFNRTGVQVESEYNSQPLVDWVLMEVSENNETYFKLICLMAFVVKKFSWQLSFRNQEDVIDGNWYDIEALATIPNVAPNCPIVTKKALEFMINN